MYTGTETPYTYTKHYSQHSAPGKRIAVHQIGILNRDMGIQIECKCSQCVIDVQGDQFRCLRHELRLN